jgi:hypothetical protein
LPESVGDGGILVHPDAGIEALVVHRIHTTARFVLSEDAMSQTPSPTDQTTAQNLHVWVQYVPDGAVSVAVEDSTLVLKASNVLQERFETLLAKRKAGTLSDEETREYQAMCDLDIALSWLNRLARESRNA